MLKVTMSRVKSAGMIGKSSFRVRGSALTRAARVSHVHAICDIRHKAMSAFIQLAKQ